MLEYKSDSYTDEVEETKKITVIKYPHLTNEVLEEYAEIIFDHKKSLSDLAIKEPELYRHLYTCQMCEATKNDLAHSIYRRKTPAQKKEILEKAMEIHREIFKLDN